MRAKSDSLLSALLGANVLAKAAKTHGVKQPTVRALLGCAALSAGNHKPTITALASALGCNYFTAYEGVSECLKLPVPWLERQVTIGWGLRLTLEGLRVVGLLQRAEREARRKFSAECAELPTWPRKYTKRQILP